MTKSLRKMRPGTQIAVLCGLFSLPVAVALYFISCDVNKEIDFSRWEQYGNQYQRPLEQLLNDLPQHQALLERDRVAGAEPGNQVSILQSQLDSTFDALQKVDEKLSVALQFT